MLGVRHEKYGNSMTELPYSLGIDLKRDRYNFSKEQNWHENLEIQLFTEGSGTVLLNGEKYDIQKGDVVIVNSNVIHYTFTDTSLVYTCIIISTDWCRRMNINYDTLNFSPLIKEPRLNELILKLVSVSLNSEDNLRTAKTNEILLKTMIELAENHCSSIAPRPLQNKNFETVTSTIDFIHKNFHQKITLSEISQAVFFDKYALCKEFKKYTGQTIFEYLNHYRSIKATDYLSEGYTVSETASLCGFENLSFFAKIFKKYIGTTPSQYKKSRS